MRDHLPMHDIVMVSGATTTDWITAVATGVGAPVAAVGLIVAAVQLRGQRRATEAQFLLSLDEAFRAHDHTHRRFRPPSADRRDQVGRWHGQTADGPETAEEWANVEAYMGLFERINVMINAGLIRFETFQPLYGYPRRLGYDVPPVPRAKRAE